MGSNDDNGVVIVVDATSRHVIMVRDIWLELGLCVGLALGLWVSLALCFRVFLSVLSVLFPPSNIRVMHEQLGPLKFTCPKTFLWK